MRKEMKQRTWDALVAEFSAHPDVVLNRKDIDELIDASIDEVFYPDGKPN